MKAPDLTEGIAEMLDETRRHYEALLGTCINCGEPIDQCECGQFKARINELIPDEPCN